MWSLGCGHGSKGPSRPVCFVKNDALQGVIFTEGAVSASGSGCSVPRVATGAVVHFPTTSPDTPCLPLIPPCGQGDIGFLPFSAYFTGSHGAFQSEWTSCLR